MEQNPAFGPFQRFGAGGLPWSGRKKRLRWDKRQAQRVKAMQVISFMNMKGGVGKTTLAVNIAYGLAYYHGKKILIVDADPQFNGTQCLLEDDDYLSHVNDPTKGTLQDVFTPKRPGPVRTVTGVARAVNRQDMALANCICQIATNSPTGGRLDLLPSTLALIELDSAQRGTERRLKAFIAKKASHYDYVIIDCPPTISIFTQAAILASDKYIVPIKPDPLSVIGLPLLERWLNEFTEDNGIQVSRIGLVLTMVRGPIPTRMRQVISDLRRSRPGDVFSEVLSVATAVAASVESHQPIFLYKRASKSATQIGRITAEFLARVGV